MIVSENSPLRKRDAAIDRRQTVFLDAILYSVDMADVAHARLQSTLASGSPQGALTVLDVWSMVDSLHRLRELLDQMPGIKNNSPTLQVLLRSTGDIELLRNGVQHLRHEIDTLVNENLPVWGILNWVAPRPGGKSVQTGMFVAGTLSNYEDLPMINPLGKNIVFPVDHITLTAFGRSVNLSEVMRRYVEPLVRKLEGQLKDKLPPPPGDETLRIDLEL